MPRMDVNNRFTRPLSPGAGMQVTTERLFARQWMPSVHPGMGKKR